MSTTKFNEYHYQLGWDRVYGHQGPRGCLYLLPSESSGVIVQYDPEFRISCCLPEKKRSVVTDWKGQEDRAEVKSPFLIWSQLFYLKRDFCNNYGYIAQHLDLSPSCLCEDCQNLFSAVTHPPTCYCEVCRIPGLRQQRIVNSFYLFAVNTDEENDIVAQPYRLSGNIYEDGRVCFRKNSSRSHIRIPQNLREAHATFWMHRFDNDFNWKIPHTCERRIHSWRNCGKRKKRVHKCRRGRNHNHLAHTCEIKPHRRCACCHKNCYCFELCACCMKKCNCESKWPNTCNCPCCKNICSCPCSCILAKDFARMVSNYQPPPDKWEVYTSLICGESFFASTNKATGVFISYDPQFLSNIPRQFWRTGIKKPNKMVRSDMPFVIGIANPKTNTTWDIDLGEFQFSLNQDQIALIG